MGSLSESREGNDEMDDRRKVDKKESRALTDVKVSRFEVQRQKNEEERRKRGGKRES